MSDVEPTPAGFYLQGEGLSMSPDRRAALARVLAGFDLSLTVFYTAPDVAIAMEFPASHETPPPVPATRADFYAYVARRPYSSPGHAANRAWYAIRSSGKLWVPDGLPDPYPDTPVQYLDSERTVVDLRSVAARLGASQCSGAIWYDSFTKDHTASPRLVELVGDITHYYISEAGPAGIQPNTTGG